MDSGTESREECFELLDVGVGIFDRASKLVHCNAAFWSLRKYPEDLCRPGVTLEALLRFNAERGDFGAGGSGAHVAKRIAEIGETQSREIERRMADGQILKIRYRRTRSGGLMVTFEDCTAERRTQRALAASKERYALVSEAAEEAIYEWDIAGERFYASPRLVELIGRDWGEGSERPWDWSEIIHPDDLEHYREMLAKHLCGAEPRWGCKYRLQDASGSWRWVSDHGTSIRGEDGEAIRMVAAIRDITERRAKDAALAASEERHSLVTRATSDGIYDWNIIDDQLYVSDNLIRILDFDFDIKASGRWNERVHADDYDNYVAAIRAHFRGETEVLECEYRVRGTGGGYRWIQDRGIGVRNKGGRVVRMVGAVRDISEMKQARARLVQAEKMASLGHLTAGIAHEIKNPLNFVNNFAKLSDELLAELAEILEAPIKALDEESRDDAEDLFQTVRENLGKINEHGKRADSIVKNMLLHSREGPSEQQVVNLNAIADEALNLAYHGARAENSKFNIEILTSLAEDVGEVECFPQDLMRVFLNLITNGMYAANKRGTDAGGDFSPTISLTTSTDGDRIGIEVRDNGTGIPADVREKIFVPFFTTKPAGEGTGLGLSLSYDIVVKQHGGELTVDSNPGEFTAFRVTIPRTLPASGGNGR